MTTTSKSGRRWLKWILAASLTLNMLTLGAVGGRLLAGGPLEGSPFNDLPQIVQALPESDRLVMQQALRDAAGQIRTALVEVRRARRSMIVAMAAEPFDPEALDTALYALRARIDDALAAVHQVVLRVSDQLSPEGRAAVAESSIRMGRHGIPPGNWWRRPPERP